MDQRPSATRLPDTSRHEWPTNPERFWPEAGSSRRDRRLHWFSPRDSFLRTCSMPNFTAFRSSRQLENSVSKICYLLIQRWFQGAVQISFHFIYLFMLSLAGFCRLTSPSGTQTVLLFERPRDVLDSSFEDWPFMSVHFWGERAAGRWKLEILNAGNKRVNKAGNFWWFMFIKKIPFIYLFYFFQQ